MLRYLFVLLALALSPGSAEAQEKPRAGGELVFAVPVEAPSYDAHREGTFGIVHPAAPHYNTLLRVDPMDRTGTRVVGDLAHTWTITDEGRTYTLKLRKGVKFHDGTEMTARDAKASYDKIINPPAERRLVDEEAHYFFTLQWHRIVPHSAKLRGWTITPSHYLNQQLDTVWLAE